MFFTFKQCAELAEVKESTARFYRDTFPSFFSSVNEGRKRQYHPSCVEVIKFISANYAQNLTQEQIYQLLEEKYGVTVKDATQEINNAKLELHNALATQAQENSITQTQLLNTMKSAFSEEFEKRQNEITMGMVYAESLITVTKLIQKYLLIVQYKNLTNAFKSMEWAISMKLLN